MTDNINVRRLNDLQLFYSEVLGDYALQSRLMATTDLDSLSEVAVEIGKEKGYSFTKEDVKAAAAQEAGMGGENEERILKGIKLAQTCNTSMGCGCGFCLA